MQGSQVTSIDHASACTRYTLACWQQSTSTTPFHFLNINAVCCYAKDVIHPNLSHGLKMIPYTERETWKGKLQL